MTYALYTNPGTLDMRAVTIMGLHAKPNSDNPIGDFGTGLKYSIAVLLRHHAFIVIQTGDGNEYHIRKEDSDFRGEEIEQLVLVNVTTGVETLLPYTTRLGKNWGLWQVMRELECNARDEGGEFLWSDTVKPGEPNTVNIYVQCNEFTDTIKQERPTVFFDQIAYKEKTIAANFDFLHQPSQHMYCRGIRVYTSQNYPFMQTYNFTSKLQLTEDRTLAYMFTPNAWIGEYISQCDDAYMLEKLLTAEGSWEFQYCIDDALRNNPSQLFFDVATRLFKAGKSIPQPLARAITRRAVDEEMARRVEMSSRENDMLSTAISVCRFAGYDVDDYEIKVVNRLREGVLGMADEEKQTILLSKYAFEHGVECVTGTLIEEWLHLSRGLIDESRQLQDWLLRQLTVRIMDRYVERTEQNDTSSS